MLPLMRICLFGSIRCKYSTFGAICLLINIELSMWWIFTCNVGTLVLHTNTKQPKSVYTGLCVYIDGTFTSNVHNSCNIISQYYHWMLNCRCDKWTYFSFEVGSHKQIGEFLCETWSEQKTWSLLRRCLSHNICHSHQSWSITEYDVMW